MWLLDITYFILTVAMFVSELEVMSTEANTRMGEATVWAFTGVQVIVFIISMITLIIDIVQKVKRC